MLLAGLSPTTSEVLAGSSKKKGKGKATSEEGDSSVPPASTVKLYLEFKRYMYDPKKKMVQSR